MKYLFKKLYKPHSLIVTVIILLFIWMLDEIRLNLHVLDPFNNTIKDYEIQDIVFSQLRSEDVIFEDDVILVDIGEPQRMELARLIERLSEAGAAVIGLDVLLEGSKTSEEDFTLQKSIARAGNVVLASFLEGHTRPQQRFESESQVDSFFSNYAATGYVNFLSNETRIIRMFSPREETANGEAKAFSVRIVEKYDPQAVKRLDKRRNEVERINYIGNTNSFVHYNKEHVLDTTIDLTSDVEGKIALLGFIGDDDFCSPLNDRLYTPLNERYSGRTPPDMYGVVIHANIISMIINGKYIYTIPKWVSLVLAFLFCYVNVVVIHWIYQRFHESFHGITRVLQIIEFLILFFFIAAIFYWFKIKFNFNTGILALVLAYDFVMIYESFVKNRFPGLERIG